MKRRIIITVDVEAQPVRASDRHIDRLIYGRFGGDSDFGIEKMFDIAERHDVRLTCFLDYAEQFLYGDALLDVGRYIAFRNQDLQVHLHPEFIPRTVFDAAGVKYGVDMFAIEKEQADFLIDIAVDAHMRVTTTPPVAFRGGGYRYGESILNKLGERKFLFNSGYNPSRKNQPFNIGSRKQFRWAGGIVELPISCVWNFKNTGRLFDYNFNADVLMKGAVKECVAKHETFLQEYFHFHGDDAIAVMVMHSWSFVNISERGYYDAPNGDYIEKFDALLQMLSENHEVITAGDLALRNVQALTDSTVLYSQNKGPVSGVVNEEKRREEKRREEKRREEKRREEKRREEKRRESCVNQPPCPVCGAGNDRFQDFNGPKRKCGVCGSLERQRAFAVLIKSDKWRLNLRNSRVLLVSPSVSERKLFSALPGVEFSTLDIRGEVKPDIVADLCDMSGVPNGSFDVVYACHVLSHVHDLSAALSELSRVLSDDGVLINYEPISKGSNTKELEEIAEISSHYGIEAFQKYKLGRFRNFGELDIEKIFSPFFKRSAYDSVDEITGVKIVWNVWKKIVGGSRVAPTKTYDYVVRDCPVCHDSLAEFESGENCKQCGSRARLRSLYPFVDQYVNKEISVLSLSDRPLLAFAMTAAEKKVLSRAFKKFKSVSLFGNYATDHETGVDTRDLSRYESNSFSGVFGCLLFDYFVEHELALQECFRVTAPGGLFFTHIACYRIVDGDTPPLLKNKIKSRAGYFEYLPNNTELPDVKVGRNWFVAAMRRVGFQPVVVRVEDTIPGMVSEWFVGIKPTAIGSRSSLAPTDHVKDEALGSKISEVFHSVIPFGEKGRASLKIELIEGLSSSLLFIEDHLLPAVGGLHQTREIVAANGSRNCIYTSCDLGVSWVKKYASIQWDDRIRAVFSLRDGGRLVRTFSGRMYHLDGQGSLVSSQDTGAWHWHGSQGIGESSSGTVMYAEYAPLRTEDGVQQLSVWRYRLNQREIGWKRVLTLPAAVRPPEGQLRHFHVCRPNPVNLKQWILAAGDVGVHNRLWLSNDDGDNWSEVKLSESNTLNLPRGRLPQVLRFTQFSTLSNGDLIWGTDDTAGSGRAALIKLSTVAENPTFHFLGWLGKNCVRNISFCGNDLFLIISESAHDLGAADCILYDASRNRMVSLLLPNISQAKHPVTDSLGSTVLPGGGPGFYPALGAVLMNPDKRGIFRISIKETDQ